MQNPRKNLNKSVSLLIIGRVLGVCNSVSGGNWSAVVKPMDSPGQIRCNQVTKSHLHHLNVHNSHNFGNSMRLCDPKAIS